MKRRFDPPHTYDAGMTGPGDDHRRSPLLPWLVLGVGVALLVCGVLGYITFG